MYKVLALDLDGTVLNQDHQIHPAVKAAIQQARDYCQVMIVTGRHHTTALPYHDELGLNTPIICCNGAYLYDAQTNSILAEHALDKMHALEFIKLVQNYKVKMVMYADHAMYYSSTDPVSYVAWLTQWANTIAKPIRPTILATDCFEQQAQQSERVWKFVLEAAPQQVDELVKHPFIQRFFVAERSWSDRIDFTNKGNTKGRRLAEYINTQGIPAAKVIAVGDNHNDISMFELAGLGVAMANASDEVKRHATMVTATDNDQDGLARFIQATIIPC